MEFRNKQNECDLAVMNTKGYCSLGRKAGRGCRCFSPLAGTKGLGCPYYWKGPCQPISMKDIEEIELK